jgi:hypothetical protein
MNSAWAEIGPWPGCVVLAQMPNRPDDPCQWHAGARVGRSRRTRGRRGGAPPGGLPAAPRQGLRHDDEGTEGGGTWQGEEDGVSPIA